MTKTLVELQESETFTNADLIETMKHSVENKLEINPSLVMHLINRVELGDIERNTMWELAKKGRDEQIDKRNKKAADGYEMIMGYLHE
ncbi:MAG TPA: hypothetical protein VLB02_01145 [Candidatus Paceibacterota bacterium]|nr:hypothetical protein [Candidatus Paceibacterota bacterium]